MPRLADRADRDPVVKKPIYTPPPPKPVVTSTPKSQPVSSPPPVKQEKVEISDSARKALQNSPQPAVVKSEPVRATQTVAQPAPKTVPKQDTVNISEAAKNAYNKPGQVSIKSSDQGGAPGGSGKGKPENPLVKDNPVTREFELQKNERNQKEEKDPPKSKPVVIVQENKPVQSRMQGPVESIDYITVGGSLIAGGGVSGAITVDKNWKVYAGAAVGVGLDVGFSGKAGYIPDSVKPEQFIPGTGINESVQVGVVGGGITKSYPGSNAPTGVEVGVGGKVPLGGSITYGKTVEILDVKKDIIEPVEHFIDKVKDIFKDKEDKKDKGETNIIEKIVRGLFG